VTVERRQPTPAADPFGRTRLDAVRPAGDSHAAMALRLVHGDAAAVCLIAGDSGDREEIVGAAGFTPGRDDAGVRAIARTASRGRRPIVVPDLRATRQRFGRSAERAGWSAALAAGWRGRGDCPPGAIVVMSRLPRGWTEHEVGALEGLAAAMANNRERGSGLDRLRGRADAVRRALEAGRVGVWEWEIAPDRFTWLGGLAVGLSGGHLHDFLATIDVADRERLESAFRQAAAGNNLSGLARLAGVARPGRRLDLSGQPRRDASGRPISVSGVAFEVGARAGLEDPPRLAAVQYRALMEQIPVVSYVIADDAPGAPQYVSAQVERLVGYPPEAWVADPGLWLKLVHPEDAAWVRAAFARSRESGAPFSAEYRVVGHDGRLVWVRDEAALVRDGADGRRFWQGIVIDVSGRREVEEALRASEARYRAVVDSAFDAIVTMTADGLIHSFNGGAERVFGYRSDEVVGRPLAMLMPDRFRRAHGAGITRYLATGEARVLHRTIALSGQRKDGTEVPLEMSITEVLDGSGRLFTGILRDITQRKALEEQLVHQAFHDPLTRLPNRTLFMDRLTQALGRAARSGSVVAVLFLDLDNFKLVNDTLGHSAGDELLVAVADRVRGCLRLGDTAARLGGDEFTVLLEDVEDVAAVVRAARRIVRTLKRPLFLARREVVVNASIGIALGGRSADAADDLLRNADVAMYRAKRKGKARYEVFDPSMHTPAIARLALEAELREAIARSEFQVYYQPKILTATGAIVGVEALARWRHPARGMVVAADFVPVAEETGLVVPIGHWVFREACRQVRHWQLGLPGGPPLRLSVNLSAREVQEPGLVEAVAATLVETGLDPSALCLEIAESVVMEEVPETLELLERLKEIGVQVSIDDFGIGSSSLARLKRLPLDGLKIDRSFTGGLGADPGDLAIVSALIDLSHALGLQVVAEGVETAEQLAVLHALGCDMVQGFYVSVPVPDADMARLLGADRQVLSVPVLGVGPRRSSHVVPAVAGAAALPG